MHIPGREVAGRVDAVSAGVDPDLIGRRVVVHLGVAGGGYASEAVADVASLIELDDHVDPAQAVAMVGTGRTTLAILEVAQLTGADVVVVTAAAGGIGSLVVQEAKRLGATVVGLAGGEDKWLRWPRSVPTLRSTTPGRAGPTRCELGWASVG